MDTVFILSKEQTNAPLKISGHATKPICVEVPDTAFVKTVKRISDLLFAIVLITLLLSWMIPVLFLMIRLSSRGPLFFMQKRIGLNGKEFTCIKFRTMKVNKHSDTIQADIDDKRITKFGFFLRVTHIDELPQLFNVLMNDMSLVGPRPHMVYHDELFSSMIPGYSFRHKVKPGITGLAQVAGYHGATPDIQSIAGRTRLDLFYVRKVSFLLDMKILFKTLFVSPVKLFTVQWK